MNQRGKAWVVQCLPAKHDDEGFVSVGVNVGERMAKPMDWAVGHGRGLDKNKRIVLQNSPKPNLIKKNVIFARSVQFL